MAWHRPSACRGPRRKKERDKVAQRGQEKRLVLDWMANKFSYIYFIVLFYCFCWVPFEPGIGSGPKRIRSIDNTVMCECEVGYYVCCVQYGKSYWGLWFMCTMHNILIEAIWLQMKVVQQLGERRSAAHKRNVLSSWESLETHLRFAKTTAIARQYTSSQFNIRASAYCVRTQRT